MKRTSLWKYGPMTVATAFLLGLIWVVNTAIAQGPNPLANRPTSVDAAVASRINYQGVLKENGAPVTGSRNLTFTFHTNSSCAGGEVDSVSLPGVSVSNGLFQVYLDIAPATFVGSAIWVQLAVGATPVSCDEVRPVPYALSLRPGAQVQGDPTAWDGFVYKVTMSGSFPLGKAIWGSTATGSGVRGDSLGGNALFGVTETGYGVYGYDTGTATARGYGGYFLSENGVGLFGQSNGISHFTNMYAPGVYGLSAHGAGVYGRSTATTWPAYGGVFEGPIGVGVRSSGPPADSGYAGTFVSENYRGIYGRSLASYYDAYFDGAAGIYSAAGYTAIAAARTLVINGGTVALEKGDVVAIAGTTVSPATGQLILTVQKADMTNGAAVIGVVAGAMAASVKQVQPGQNTLDFENVPGAASPGQHVTVVTSGLALVKVDATSAPAAIGDWIAVSGTSGIAAKADAAERSLAGVLGKAAGSVDVQTGLMPVFVSLK